MVKIGRPLAAAPGAAHRDLARLHYGPITEDRLGSEAWRDEIPRWIRREVVRLVRTENQVISELS